MGRKIIIYAVGILVVAVAGYVLWSKELIFVKKYKGPVEKIIVADSREYSAVNNMAKEKGYFKEYGLDVDLKTYESGAAAIGDLLADKVDIAIAGEFAGVDYIFKDSKNLRILAQISKENLSQIIARSDSGIKYPSDLKGKKIGVTMGTNREIFLYRFMTYNNLKPSDIKMIDMQPSEMTPQIVEGKIDAVSAFKPHSFFVQEKLGKNAVVLSLHHSSEATYTLIYTTQKYIEDHPRIVERYLLSLTETEKYIEKHEVETKTHLARVLGCDDYEVSKCIWPKMFLSISLEQGLLLTLEGEANWYIENKQKKGLTVPNYLDYINFDILGKIKPKAVTMIH